MKLHKNLRLPCLALGALALSSAALFAATQPFHQERGTIKSVDAKAHTLIVTDLKDKSEHKFLWNEQTRFTERGKAVSAADLKSGEGVSITYSGNADPLIMNYLRVVPNQTQKSDAPKS